MKLFGDCQGTEAAMCIREHVALRTRESFLSAKAPARSFIRVYCTLDLKENRANRISRNDFR
jgi:hypothetical protein